MRKGFMVLNKEDGKLLNKQMEMLKGNIHTVTAFDQKLNKNNMFKVYTEKSLQGWQFNAPTDKFIGVYEVEILDTDSMIDEGEIVFADKIKLLEEVTDYTEFPMTVDDLGQVTEYIVENGFVVRTFDKNSKIVREDTPEYIATSIYGESGNIEGKILAYTREYKTGYAGHNGDVTIAYEYEFDRSGNMIKKVDKFNHHLPEDDRRRSTNEYLYEYNEDGDLIYSKDYSGRTIINYTKIDGKLVHKCTNTFNNNNDLSKMDYFYDEHGELLFRMHNGSMIVYNQYTYDKDGKVLTKRGNQGEYDYEYDKEGRMINEKYYGRDGKVHQDVTLGYNHDGVVTTVIGEGISSGKFGYQIIHPSAISPIKKSDVEC